MDERPQLSPELRPLRYCPNCGQRVAQQAESCFMCGQPMVEAAQRQFRFPIADVALIVVILAVLYLWWTRGGDEGVTAAGRAVATPTPTPTATVAFQVSPTATDTATPPPTPTATPTPILYTVKRGDTIENIAREFNVALEDLLIVNGLLTTEDIIRIDQELVIPAGPLPRGPDGRPLPTATATPDNTIYLVVIRAGDTLENIARRLGTSVEAIVAANETILDADTLIHPGDQIVVPVGTIVPTATPDQRAPPTATPVPTPTPTPGLRWPAPVLLSPLDGANFAGDEPVLLQWMSAGLLDPGEVYVVRVAPEGLPREEMTVVTLGTSFRVPTDWLERQARRESLFRWSVQVARDARAVSGQASGLRATSPVSEARSFSWGAGR